MVPFGAMDEPVVYMGPRNIAPKVFVAFFVVVILVAWAIDRVQDAGAVYESNCTKLSNELEAVQQDYANAMADYHLQQAEVEMNRAVALTDQLDKAGCL